MWGHEIIFDSPKAALLLLFLLPLLYGFLALERYRQRQQYTYASPSVLSLLLTPRSPLLTYVKMIGWILIWTLICLASMEPIGNIRYLSSGIPPSTSSAQLQPRYIPHEVIFLVDTSASMDVPDGSHGETRLEQAKSLVEDIVRQLSGQMASLYAFTSVLTPVVPPTLDYLFLRLAIRELHINEGDVGGTRFAPVLSALKQQAFPEPSIKRYTVILLSDGGDNQLEALTGEAKEKERQAILTAISHPQQLHLRLFTIGIGSLKPQPIPNVTFQGQPVLSKLEPGILKQLAAQKRGIYYMAQEWASWELAQDLMAHIGEDQLMIPTGPMVERPVAAVSRQDLLIDRYYQIPLGLAILCYFLNLILPDVLRKEAS